MREYIEKHRRVVGAIAVLVALSIATIYYFIVPTEVAATGLLAVVLMYGHSLCWLLLAIAALCWTIRANRRFIRVFAYAALAVYVIFIVTYVISLS